jgi:hypothetical protein
LTEIVSCAYTMPLISSFANGDSDILGDGT